MPVQVIAWWAVSEMTCNVLSSPTQLILLCVCDWLIQVVKRLMDILETAAWIVIGPAADVPVCDWLIQVMKRLMNIPTDFWLRYVNVADDDDEVYEADDQQSAVDGALDLFDCLHLWTLWQYINAMLLFLRSMVCLSVTSVPLLKLLDKFRWHLADTHVGSVDTLC